MKNFFKSLTMAIAMSAIIMTFTGCVAWTWETQANLADTLQQNATRVAENQQALESRQPAPTVTYSNERANLIKRVKTFNDPNKLSYIYLVSKNGTVMAFYTVKGKVSNLSSYLVPDQQLIKDPNAYYENQASVVVQAPDIDGSYGTNGEGIFFYTADNTYVEWNGEYMLCDKPLKMSSQPQLVRQIEDK